MVFIVEHVQNIQKDYVKDAKEIVQNVQSDTIPVRSGHAALRMDLIHAQTVINLNQLKIANYIIHS